MRRFIVTVALTGLGLLTGCDTRNSSFVEPVALSDGRTITIKREQDFNRRGDLAEPSWMLDRSALRVVEGDFPSTEWQDYAVLPMLLDFDGDALVLIGIALNEHPKRSRVIPKPPYFQYRLRPEGWISEPLSEAFWGRTPNLVGDARSGRFVAHRVTADEKRELLKIDRQVTRKFRIIDPEASAYDSRH
jgi:hypothetical protein